MADGTILVVQALPSLNAAMLNSGNIPSRDFSIAKVGNGQFGITAQFENQQPAVVVVR